MTQNEPIEPDIARIGGIARAARRHGAALGVLALLCALLFLFRLGAPPVFDLDEGLYTAAARQMALRGDWVTPRINYEVAGRPGEHLIPFFEKPAMVYWLPALSMKLLGVSETAARLPSAIAAAITTMLVYVAGTLIFRRAAGFLAAVIFATSPLIIIDARQMTTDSLLTLWLTAALLAYWYSSRRSPHPVAGLVFWCMIAAAVLTKGAVGALLPLLVIAVDSLAISAHARIERLADGPREGQLAIRVHPISALSHAMRSLGWRQGLLVVAVLTLPWHFLIWRAGGHDSLGRTWAQEYLLIQHLGRFTGMDRVHNAPLPSYIAYLVVFFLPWAFLLVPAFRAPGAPDSAPDRRFLLVWFWTIFVFFTLGAAKLPNYIQPIYPPAALLTGGWLIRVFSARRAEARSFAGALFHASLGGLALCLLLLVASEMAPRLVHADNPLPPGTVSFAETLVLVLSACFALATIATVRPQGGRLATLIFCCIGPLLVVFGVTRGTAFAKSAIMGPYQGLSQAAQHDADLGVPIIFYRIIPRRPSMNFYARYSPIETSVAPLRKFLSSLSASRVDIASTWETYERIIAPDLKAGRWFQATPIYRTGSGGGGWVLVRVDRALGLVVPPPAQPATAPLPDYVGAGSALPASGVPAPAAPAQQVAPR